MMNERLRFVAACVRKKPYHWILLGTSPLYLLGILAVYSYIYNGNPLEFYTSFPPWFTITTTIFNIVISALFGIVITLFIAKIEELRLKSAGVGVLGILFASLAAGCPGCVFGLFPIVLSFFGISGTLAILPLSGIEFQILTVFMMGLSIVLLAKETDLSCKV